MTERGGKRSGAGRKKGSATRITRQIANRVSQEGITPLEFMLNAMRDETKEFGERYAAAKDAAPYLHPRLSNVEANVSLTGHEAALEQLD